MVKAKWRQWFIDAKEWLWREIFAASSLIETKN